MFLLLFTQMDDESLAKVMAKLEQTVGKDRVSEIRREAAKRARDGSAPLG